MHFLSFFASFRPYVRQPDNHISYEFILLTQGPIRLNLAKIYWELMVLKNVVFLSRPFWNLKKKCFCLIPWKAVKGSWVARTGRNLDDNPGFQPMRSWANTYAQDCTVMYSISHILNMTSTVCTIWAAFHKNVSLRDFYIMTLVKTILHPLTLKQIKW